MNDDLTFIRNTSKELRDSFLVTMCFMCENEKAFVSSVPLASPSTQFYVFFAQFYRSWSPISGGRGNFPSNPAVHNWFVSICALGLVSLTFLTDLKLHIIFRYSLICQQVAEANQDLPTGQKAAQLGTSAPRQQNKPSLCKSARGNYTWERNLVVLFFRSLDKQTKQEWVYKTAERDPFSHKCQIY